MRFVAISDTHDCHRRLRLPYGDVLLHAGDISLRGSRSEIADFLNWFAAQPFTYKIFIAGNHDFFFEQSGPETIRSMLPDGVIYLQDSGTVIEGIPVWGSPMTPRYFRWAFNRERGADIRRHWDLIPNDTRLLITHGPPHGFLDLTITDQHVGCQDLLRRILLIQPQVHLFGHIHESYGSVKRSGTHFINASVVNERYALTNKPVVFDLDA